MTLFSTISCHRPVGGWSMWRCFLHVASPAPDIWQYSKGPLCTGTDSSNNASIKSLRNILVVSICRLAKTKKIVGEPRLYQNRFVAAPWLWLMEKGSNPSSSSTSELHIRERERPLISNLRPWLSHYVVRLFCNKTSFCKKKKTWLIPLKAF